MSINDDTKVDNMVEVALEFKQQFRESKRKFQKGILGKDLNFDTLDFNDGSYDYFCSVLENLVRDMTPLLHSSSELLSKLDPSFDKELDI